MIIILIAGMALLLTIIAFGARVVPEYERAVVLLLGRYVGTRGPGLFLVVPRVSVIYRVDLRIVAREVPSQEVITKDNVTIKVSAVAYYQVAEPRKAIINMRNYADAVMQIAQITVRNVLGQSDLDQILSERDTLNSRVQAHVDSQTEAWGVKVHSVELKDIELPQSMQRAMSKQAEAEREKRAKIIAADGEKQSAQTLAEAAAIIARNPQALQLRYLQTLAEVAAEKNSTIVFPLPIELLRAFSAPEHASPKERSV